MPATAATAPPKRSFVPQDLDVADWSQIEPLYKALLDRPIHSPAELEQWLLDYSELASVIDEYGSRRYIDKSCHTDDEQIKQRFLHFIENIEPKCKPLDFAMQRKLLESPHAAGLTGPRYEILKRRWQADVELFREENVPLETQATKLVTEYDAICGAMTATFRGKEYTLQQLARFIEEPDRQTREEAWVLSTQRRMQDRQKIEQIFDKLLPLRQQIAANAGMSDYRAYMWKSLKRFDYTPQDCLQFSEAIAQTVVPLVDELDRQRAADLGLDRLRPWDMTVDPKNRPPLRPFSETEIDSFVNKTWEIFKRLSPQLAEDFDLLRRQRNLDLDSRKGKQPGGYQSTLNEVREPFIFMNAAGLQRDVETLLHEGGHAFHALAARDEPLVFLRHAPIEFCEVASMAMELFGADHLDVFYSQADHARAKRVHLEGIIRFFPWMAIIDCFQHWIYTHPGHTPEQRTAEWLRLMDRFASKTDWSGFEDARAALWQRQLHLFHVPFYYVEYGIAQLGALQLWLKAREDPQRALNHYRSALKLGGTRPLPELFAAAGIQFDFSEKTLRPLIDAVGEELARLPR
ncbi:MAG TPA: M3 family oligoendopeptidase [Tepidisphaeraceae bacterium]|nr:M3 family oligoendopeptidase [Tepidisphaeraceae bacterium]